MGAVLGPRRTLRHAIPCNTLYVLVHAIKRISISRAGAGFVRLEEALPHEHKALLFHVSTKKVEAVLWRLTYGVST